MARELEPNISHQRNNLTHEELLRRIFKPKVQIHSWKVSAVGFREARMIVDEILWCVTRNISHFDYLIFLIPSEQQMNKSESGEEVQRSHSKAAWNFCELLWKFLKRIYIPVARYCGSSQLALSLFLRNYERLPDYYHKNSNKELNFENQPANRNVMAFGKGETETDWNSFESINKFYLIWHIWLI